MKPICRARVLAVSFAVFLPLLLQGCGGGGGSGGDGESGGDTATTAPPAPTATLAPTATKTFAFSWSDVSDETEYRLLENPDGVSGYSQVAVIPSNSTEHNRTVSLPQRINASYILQACNSQGCADSDEVFVSSFLAEAVGYIKASNTGVPDSFGYSLALSSDGSTLAVGSIREDSGATGIDGDEADSSVHNAGAVYVFTQSDGAWSQQAYIKASNAGAVDRFGYSVALSSDGSVLAVGAPFEDSNATGIDGDQADNAASDSGAVYVFAQSDGAWSQQAYIKASNTGAGDFFGHRLALSSDGSVLAVGALGEDSSATGVDGNQADNSMSEGGAVYVFTQSDGAWSQKAYLKASNTEELDRFGGFGLALSSDGNLLAVGARYEDSSATGIDGNQADNSTSGSGAVYVFAQSDGTWSQEAYIKASNTGDGDEFGYSLALSSDGSLLAVGAPDEESSATGIDGDQADNSAGYSGAVYVFTQSDGAWSQQAYIKASNTGGTDSFGSSLALSANGSLLAVGAPDERSAATGINGNQTDNSADYSGAVYLFSQSDGTWSQQAYIKASNTGGADEFGSALALSEDGSLLAIGARDEDSNATGINGDQDDNSAEDSGAVYLY